MSKITILIYGIVSYLIGVLGLLSIILVLAKLLPFGYLWDDSTTSINPIIWNIGLVSLWGIIHSVMARPWFKSGLTKVIPEPAERATYILAAGLSSIIMTGFWINVPGEIWQVTSQLGIYMLWGLFIFGWAFLLASTFAINHFDLFGLRQVYLNFKSQPRPPLTFVKRAMYRHIRHPIQTGVLIGIWATPTMTRTQIILTLGFTAYIFIGLWFEERDLIREHGESYETYRQEAGKVLPKFSK